MKRLLIVLMLTGFVFGISGLAVAGNSATQTVTYEIQAINELSVTGNPGALIISTATAGFEPDFYIDNSTAYAISTNCGDNTKKITAAIDTDMPTGVTLMISLIAPAGATAPVEGVLSTSAVDVVTGIDAVASGGQQVIYKLTATASAGVVASASKTVTLTLTDS